MDSSRLDSELLLATRDCACLAARRHARLLTRRFDERLRPHGLRSTQFSVLAALEQTGDITLGELAELLALERTTLTRSIGILEDRGWVTTIPDVDARRRRLGIAPAGRDRLGNALLSWQGAQEEARAPRSSSAPPGAT